jgi:pyruvate kinase
VRHTKIIATLGPSSSDPAVIEAVIAAGADVVRLNFSHGTQAEHAARFRAARDAGGRLGRHISVLQDLSGPKVRTGRLVDHQPLLLAEGDRLVIAVGDDVGRPGLVFTSYAPLAAAVSPGRRLLLDDGKIELRVETSSRDRIETIVIDGGALGEHKGINAPGVPLPASGVTEKDERDLAFGLALGVDLVALSFVQSAADVERVRALTAREGRPDVPLVAKLERQEALDRLDDIFTAADGVMVARGDLGLEIPLERVPRVQRDVLTRARRRGVPAIVATQVLESMRTESRPTRAEVSDAAGAVGDGADAIMLSGETASGDYPVRAVEVLAAIITEAEREPPGDADPHDHVSALCDAAVTLARAAGAEAIVAVTREGRTARLLAMRRPRATIFAVTEREDIARRVGPLWGALPLVASLEGDLETVATRVVSMLAAGRHVPSGATVVVVATSRDLDGGVGNFLRVRRV